MGFNNRLLRPLTTLVAVVIAHALRTINGSDLITIGNDTIRAIQDA